MTEHGAHLAGAGQAGSGHEVLGAQGKEPAAYDSGHAGPAYEREDYGNGEVDLYDGPVLRQRGGHCEPERYAGDRDEHLDQALDGGVDDAAEVARYAAEGDADGHGQDHAHEPDGEGEAGRDHEAGP